MSPASDKQIFISHASEDKYEVAKPLAAALEDQGWTVWLDSHALTVGDSLTSKINEGLGGCKFGVVILSRHFLTKHWPRRELEGLAARETQTGAKVILPVWHGVDVGDIVDYYPMLADRLGVRTSVGIRAVAEELSRAMEAQNVMPEGKSHSPLHLVAGIDELAAKWSHDWLVNSEPTEPSKPEEPSLFADLTLGLPFTEFAAGMEEATGTEEEGTNVFRHWLEEARFRPTFADDKPSTELPEPLFGGLTRMSNRYPIGRTDSDKLASLFGPATDLVESENAIGSRSVFATPCACGSGKSFGECHGESILHRKFTP